jgi:hypothetical protein
LWVRRRTLRLDADVILAVGLTAHQGLSLSALAKL